MDLQSITLFQMANQRMDWLATRQKVLSENIANASTPDYKAKDIKDIDFSKELAKTGAVSMKTTNPNHLNANSNLVRMDTTNSMHIAPARNTSNYREFDVRKPFEMTLDDNGVDIEEQMVKVSKTRENYMSSANIYQKYQSMINLSLGKGLQ